MSRVLRGNSSYPLAMVTLQNSLVQAVSTANPPLGLYLARELRGESGVRCGANSNP